VIFHISVSRLSESTLASNRQDRDFNNLLKESNCHAVEKGSSPAEKIRPRISSCMTFHGNGVDIG